MEKIKTAHPKEVEICPNCGGPNNRMHRRHAKMGVGLSSPVRNLHLMTARQNETLSLRNTAAKQVMKGVSYSSFLYGPNTDPYLEYADVTRRFSSAYHQAIGSETSSTERGLVKSVHASETWTTSIRDISLVDLERMPLPLDEARIGRVGKFLRYHWLSFLISNQHIAQEIALLLPTQSLARSRFLDKSHDRPLPPHLDDLAKRMTGFMDFYLPLLTEPWATQDNLFNLGVNFAWIGQHLWKAFGHYIPARMGLSPSSSTKLIEARLEDLTFLGADKPVKRVVYNELKDAFRPDSLPAHLHPFLQYDVITDREAGLQLAEYYSNYAANKQEDLNHLIDRLNLYRRSLLGDIKRANKELRLQLPDHPVIGEIIITAQYTQTLMFILLFRRGNTHVTLEINGSNRMYGTPGNLLKENPHVTDSIGIDILPAILAQAKRRHPEIENEPQVEIVTQPKSSIRSTLAISLLNKPTGASDEDIEEAREAMKKTRRHIRNARLASVLTILGKQPDLPEVVKPRPPLFKVRHTRTEVREKLGKYASEELIDQVMRKTNDFELGNVRVTALKKDSNLFRVRVGKNFRVIYRHFGNGIFEIESFGRRDKVYEDN